MEAPHSPLGLVPLGYFDRDRVDSAEHESSSDHSAAGHSLVVFDRSRNRLSVLPTSPRAEDRCPLCNRVREPEPVSPSHRNRYFPKLEQLFREQLVHLLPASDQEAEVPRELFIDGYCEHLFEEKRFIGRGAYGSVFEVTHCLDGVELGTFAIKKVAVGNSRSWLGKVLREVKAQLAASEHPNVVTYRHAWLENSSAGSTLFPAANSTAPRVPHLFVLMELADFGCLQSLLFGPEEKDPAEELKRKLRRRKRELRRKRMRDDFELSESDDEQEKHLSTRAKWDLFLDIALGLAHLHSHGIAHRDLKPGNLLLKKSSEEDDTVIPHLDSQLRVLISDFGQSRLLQDLSYQEDTRLHTSVGTALFAAPEVVMPGVCRSGDPFKRDVWSLGMCLYALIYRALPWNGWHEDQHSLADRYARGMCPVDEPSDGREQSTVDTVTVDSRSTNSDTNASDLDELEALKRVMATMLQIEPAKRPTMPELLASPIVQKQIRIRRMPSHTKDAGTQTRPLKRQYSLQTSAPATPTQKYENKISVKMALLGAFAAGLATGLVANSFRGD
ncbi:MAG: hypothetical protein MHM6MM_001420 [Cercozoa sp. M6MM]